VGNPYTNTLPSRGYGRLHSVASPVISCTNRSCKDGGFDILQDISKMVHERLMTSLRDWANPSSPGKSEAPAQLVNWDQKDEAGRVASEIWS
jgi:hypothetical protein